MAFLLAAALAVLLYVFVGYPLLLAILVRAKGTRPVRRAEITPPVTLIISAYNEAAVIRDKLENTLRLDYPPGLLEIVVVSDASTDGTDDIVREYAPRVRLHRQPQRRGKTAGLNAAVPSASGEIVVFSDANAMYQPDTVRLLVRSFADPEVGCVTGESRYLRGDEGLADSGERAYWSYESRIKRLESALGSAVGADGALYAIRKPLWKTLPENAINDFQNPLEIVAGGWRAVYDAEARCWEQTAGNLAREFRRRVRIVSRSWLAIFRARRALNPAATGLFALFLVSHKILRWLMLVFVGLAAFAGGELLVEATGGVGQTALLLGATGLASLIVPGTRQLSRLGAYFLFINTASLTGIISGTLGYTPATWDTPRSARLAARRPLEISSVLLVLVMVALFGALGVTIVQRPWLVGRSLFWGAVGSLLYLHVGYPLLLFLLRPWFRRPVFASARYEPRVAMLIAAHNEAEVIRAKIQNSLAIDYPADRFEVVVASDGSDDGTNEIVAQYADKGVRLVALPSRRGKISAINAAMATIDAEVVVLTDANVFARPEAVRMLVRNLADERVGAVSGDVVLVGSRADMAASEDLYYRYERWLQRSESDIGSMVGVDGALYALRRELFQPQPADTILDDMAIPMTVVRLGRRVVYEPEAVGYEEGIHSAAEEFSRKSRIVAGAVQFLRRSGPWLLWLPGQVVFALLSHKLLRWLSPIVAWIGFLSCLLLARDSVVYLLLSVGQLLFLLLAAAGCVPRLRRMPVFGLPYYVCMVHLAAAVGVFRGLFHLQSATWQRFSRAPVG